MTISGLQLHYSGSVNLSFEQASCLPKAFLTPVVYESYFEKHGSRAYFLVCGMDLHSETQNGLGNPELWAQRKDPWNLVTLEAGGDDGMGGPGGATQVCQSRLERGWRQGGVGHRSSQTLFQRAEIGKSVRSARAEASSYCRLLATQLQTPVVLSGLEPKGVDRKARTSEASWYTVSKGEKVEILHFTS